VLTHCQPTSHGLESRDDGLEPQTTASPPSATYFQSRASEEPRHDTPFVTTATGLRTDLRRRSRFVTRDGTNNARFTTNKTRFITTATRDGTIVTRNDRSVVDGKRSRARFITIATRDGTIVMRNDRSVVDRKRSRTRFMTTATRRKRYENARRAV
jgi:hypothetical protein